MSNKSFAEILNEFTNPKTANNHIHTSSNSFENTVKYSQEQTFFELNQLEILRKGTPADKNSDRVFKFKQAHAYQAFTAKSDIPSFKKAKKQETKATIESKKRISGKPHKLNEAQQKALSYFINNHEFLLEDFTKEELRKSFKKLCFKKHPDSPGGSHQSFLELKKHYDQLSLVLKNAA